MRHLPFALAAAALTLAALPAHATPAEYGEAMFTC